MFDSDKVDPLKKEMEITYLNELNHVVAEKEALRKIITFYNSDGNLEKTIINVRFSLDMDW